MTIQEREFDIVVWGATGFTGSLVAEYLLDTRGADGRVRWALAARDAAKLDALKKSLGSGAAALPTIIADSNDEASLDALTQRTRVVITTVGPYAKYGSALVAACVRNATHYCDLAGETQWIQKMIDEHHESAANSGTRIVHCCGFDSVPSDLSVWYLQQQASARFGNYCRSITMLVKAMKGGASGGTFASMLNIIRESRADRSIARALANPYTLNPPGEREGPERRDQKSAELHTASGQWTAPFVMAGINTRVVRRSHALQGYPYGRDFSYHEAVSAGRGASGRIKANMLTAGIGAFVTAAAFDLSRSALERFVLPEPGEGPDAEARENGFYDLRTYGELDDGTVIRGKTTGDRDPGYGSTSKMLSECALCLARDDLQSPGGVLTPAVAMGDALLARLTQNAGLTFEILDESA